MTDPREWTVAVLDSVAFGVILAVVSAPTWCYPVVLGGFLAALVLYQRHLERETTIARRGAAASRHRALTQPLVRWALMFVAVGWPTGEPFTRERRRIRLRGSWRRSASLPVGLWFGRSCMSGPLVAPLPGSIRAFADS
jgi:hypothetical protein